ncbi:MAG: chemotaxis protein CheD [Desulfuromonadaceae bacterium]|nr:chemotaxis protein CheD [Desulfuromonadaceae bacterium]MDD2855440.1 chemotaxis protein CheD [Desulfuromonadaceae bacterium]
MKSLFESHTHSVYLKPGEVVVSRKPLLVSTVLGSCVAVTMFSSSKSFAAICHAMLPENFGSESDFRYVDTAIRHINDKIRQNGVGNDLVVKLFGGAQVLNVAEKKSQKKTIGDQNVTAAEKILSELGFNISARDTGGLQGRKLFFCTRSGDVYMRKMRGREVISEEMNL